MPSDLVSTRLCRGYAALPAPVPTPAERGSTRITVVAAKQREGRSGQKRRADNNQRPQGLKSLLEQKFATRSLNPCRVSKFNFRVGWSAAKDLNFRLALYYCCKNSQ
jgi:hypothetical protein